MQLALAYQDALPSSHREALYAAAEILSDSIVDDQVAIRDGSWEANGSYLAGMLPRRYLPRYTPSFIRRFHLCLLTVIWRLGQYERLPLSCVAEELAAHLLIEEARATLEEQGEGADFGPFEDALFEDLDFEMLYDNTYDGIEETAFAEMAGITHLAFADWFTRFSPTESYACQEPHSLTQDASTDTDDITDDITDMPEDVGSADQGEDDE